MRTSRTIRWQGITPARTRRGWRFWPPTRTSPIRFDLSPQAFGAVLDRVRRFYQLSIIDCGPEIEHPVMQAVLSRVDSLIIVGTMNFDGAAAAETTIKWLAARSEYQGLLRRSALVLNDVYDNADNDFLAKVRETIGQRRWRDDGDSVGSASARQRAAGFRRAASQHPAGLYRVGCVAVAGFS